MFVEHPVALARADKNLKKDVPWISVSAVGMFLGSPTDIQRIGPTSEIDIFWTSTGLTCVMWVKKYPGRLAALTGIDWQILKFLVTICSRHMRLKVTTIGISNFYTVCILLKPSLLPGIGNFIKLLPTASVVSCPKNCIAS